jgi:hypothetical protein
MNQIGRSLDVPSETSPETGCAGTDHGTVRLAFDALVPRPIQTPSAATPAEGAAGSSLRVPPTPSTDAGPHRSPAAGRRKFSAQCASQNSWRGPRRPRPILPPGSGCAGGEFVKQFGDRTRGAPQARDFSHAGLGDSGFFTGAEPALEPRPVRLAREVSKILVMPPITGEPRSSRPGPASMVHRPARPVDPTRTADAPRARFRPSSPQVDPASSLHIYHSACAYRYMRPLGSEIPLSPRSEPMEPSRRSTLRHRCPRPPSGRE